MRNTNGKHTSLPRPPAWGSYWLKILAILIKNQTIIFTKIFEKNVLGPFDQSAYIHMRNLMKYFGAEVTVYFFSTGTENPFIIAQQFEKSAQN